MKETEMCCAVQAEINFPRVAMKQSEGGREDSHSRVGIVALYELQRDTSPKQLHEVFVELFLLLQNHKLVHLPKPYLLSFLPLRGRAGAFRAENSLSASP
jgi:hypothetical protein